MKLFKDVLNELLIEKSFEEFLIEQEFQIDELINLLPFDTKDAKSAIKKDFKKRSTNVMSIIADVMYKYDGEDVYISFRDMNTQTLVNPINQYDTPTGFYCYPLKQIIGSTLNLNSWSDLRNIEYGKFFSTNVFPYKVESEFMTLFHVKNNGNVYYTSKQQDVREKVREIMKDFPELQDIPEVKDYVETGRYYSKYFKKTITNAHSLWGFIYDLRHRIKNTKFSGKANLFFTQICYKYDIDGFVDDKGTSMIHPNEPIQAVFFTQLKKLVDYYEVLSKSSGRNFRGLESKSEDGNEHRQKNIRKSIETSDKISLYLTKVFKNYVTLVDPSSVRNLILKNLPFAGVMDVNGKRVLRVFEFDPYKKTITQINPEKIKYLNFNEGYPAMYDTNILKKMGFDFRKDPIPIKNYGISDESLNNYYVVQIQKNKENYATVVNLFGNNYKGNITYEKLKELQNVNRELPTAVYNSVNDTSFYSVVSILQNYVIIQPETFEEKKYLYDINGNIHTKETLSPSDIRVGHLLEYVNTIYKDKNQYFSAIQRYELKNGETVYLTVNRNESFNFLFNSQFEPAKNNINIDDVSPNDNFLLTFILKKKLIENENILIEKIPDLITSHIRAIPYELGENLYILSNSNYQYFIINKNAELTLEGFNKKELSKLTEKDNFLKNSLYSAYFKTLFYIRFQLLDIRTLQETIGDYHVLENKSNKKLFICDVDGNEVDLSAEQINNEIGNDEKNSYELHQKLDKVLKIKFNPNVNLSTVIYMEDKKQIILMHMKLDNSFNFALIDRDTFDILDNDYLNNNLEILKSKLILGQNGIYTPMILFSTRMKNFDYKISFRAKSYYIIYTINPISDIKHHKIDNTNNYYLFIDMNGKVISLEEVETMRSDTMAGYPSFITKVKNYEKSNEINENLNKLIKKILKSYH